MKCNQDHLGQMTTIPKPNYTRTMASIINADVVGFSRLMGQDEEATLAALNTRIAAARESAAQYDGRLFGDIGDNFMVEFGRPLDAVRFAVAFQRQMVSLDDESLRMQFRLGINIGWVLSDGERLYGDGVNLSARLQKEAEPGGITLSRAVYVQVADKCDFDFENMGLHRLHNFSLPVDIYRLKAQAPSRAPETTAGNTATRSLPDVSADPTLAILAFDVIGTSCGGGKSDQAFLGQAVASDIKAGLWHNDWLTIISQNSSFLYERATLNISAIGKSLGADYIVSGVIERFEDRIQIDAVLEHAQSQYMIWSKRFSGPLDMILDMRKQIAHDLIRAMELEIGRGTATVAPNENSAALTIWEIIHRGHAMMSRRTSWDTAHAHSLFEEAHQRDPNNLEAILALAWSNFWQAWLSHGTESAVKMLDEAKSYAARALFLDSMDARGHAYMGMVGIMKGEPESSISYLDEAVRLNRSFWMAYSARGSAYLYCGKPHKALAGLLEALRLNPSDPMIFHNFGELSAAYFFANDLDSCINAAEQSLTYAPNYWYAQLIQAVALSERNDGKDLEKAQQLKSALMDSSNPFKKEKISKIPYRCSDYYARLEKGFFVI